MALVTLPKPADSQATSVNTEGSSESFTRREV
jgi:hypothetical protein